MERLGALDAVFLAIEDRTTPMNIGSVALFDGPPPEQAAISQFLANRIATIPRCRQRVVNPLGPLVRGMWIDDVSFKPAGHIHHIVLDEIAPGSLDTLVADILARPLNRRHPLWQIAIVNGLPDDCWAIIAVTHHCLVDGIGGNDLLSAVLTAEPQTRLPATHEPSTFTLVLFTLRSILTSWAAHVRGMGRAIAHPMTTSRKVHHIARAAKGLWWNQPHVPTTLIGPIHAGRRWTHSSIPLATVEEIQTRFGGTVNDIVVTAVAGGFQGLLKKRGESLDERTLTAMVPVSLRHSFERGGTGNRVANVHARLPLDIHDPKVRLEVIRNHLSTLKHSHETDATSLVMNIGNLLMRPLADRISQTIVRRQRSVETVITNVPGPHEPIYLEGHRLIEAYPIAPIAGQVRITVAVWSYCGNLFFGITADQESVPDIEILARGILDDLTSLATVN